MRFILNTVVALSLIVLLPAVAFYVVFQRLSSTSIVATIGQYEVRADTPAAVTSGDPFFPQGCQGVDGTCCNN